MAKVSEVVAILKKQADLIGKLRSEKADLLAALRVAREIACSLADPEHCLHSGSINWAQVRDEFGAAIEKAS